MIKKILSIALLIVALSACKETPVDNVIPVASVSLNQTEAEMQVGETLQLQAQISPSNATDKTLTWNSSKQSVATVSDAGLVTAVGEGTAKITVTASGKTANCEVTVIKSDTPVEPVHVESISLDKETAAMEIGETLALTATVLPDNADDKSVAWKSTNPEIAEVDQNGNVTAVSEGSATITATAGGKSATCQVTVTAAEVPVVHVESVSLDKTDAKMETGGTLTLVATVLPENADDKSVSWQSTNPEIAQVDQNGNVTAVSSGSVTITVTTTDGGRVAGCEVTVTAAQQSGEQYDGEENGHKYVDLELPSGIKWATRNVGASSPEDYGSYYAWGETVTKSEYGLSNYSLGDKYDSEDGLSELLPQDDAAHVVMGEKWYIPTKAEMQELFDNCTFERYYVDEKGFFCKVTSKRNGKSIILPAAGSKSYKVDEYVGSGFVYWTSSLIVDWSSQSLALNTHNGEFFIDGRMRFIGGTIRAVTGRQGVAVESISLDKTHVDMHPGGQITLVATVLPANASDKSYTWASTNSAIAEVDQTGKVTAKSVGTVTITATTIDGGKVAGCEVTVTNVYIPVESISILYPGVHINKGETAQLEVVVRPDNASNKTVTWTSSNTNVVTVDQQGRITGVGGGNAVITAEADGRTATSPVNVSVPAESITLNKTNIQMKVGTMATINATVLPEDYTTILHWNSSNPDVVTVLKGALTAHAVGQSTITVSADNAPAVTCTVTVTENDSYVPVEYLVFDYPMVEMSLGENRPLSVTVVPDNATNKTVTWYSSDSRVATVNAYGIMTAVGIGNAIITAKADGKASSFEVTVKSNIVPVERIQLNLLHEVVLKGSTLELTATVSPANATDPTVTWSSEDPGVATVDASGHVTSVEVGETIIWARAGDKAAYCRIVVVANPERIELNATELTLTKGEKFTLIGTVIPTNANDTKVYYESSDLNIAHVDERTGEIIAKGLGTAVITAKNTFTGITATCTVTVVAAGPPAIILEQDSFIVDDTASSGNIIPLQLINTDSSLLQATVSTDSNWIGTTVVGASVTFYVTENRSTLSHTATITITYSTATATVTVTQRGKTPTGPSDIELNIDPNANNGLNPYGGDCSVYARVINPVEGVQMELSTDVDWITNLRAGINDNYYFTVGRNTTGQARTGHFILTYGSVTKRIYFVQAPVSANIVITPNNMTFNYQSQVVSFNVVLPEGFDYGNLTFEPSDYWITDIELSGSIVSFRIKENNNAYGDNRTGSIKVSYGNKSEYFRFTQTFDTPVMTINPTSLTVNYAYQTQIIGVDIVNKREAYEVYVQSDEEWVHGAGVDDNGNLMILFGENLTGADRSTTLKVYYEIWSEIDLKVTQTASGTTINVPENYTCSSEAQTYTTTITVTDPRLFTSVEVSSEIPWIDVIVRMQSETLYNVTMTISRNASSEPRSASLVFTYGDISKIMVVTQEGDISIPEGFVDLGLSSGTLWAKMNLGAMNDYGAGNYYAWAETSPKTSFTWDNYKWGKMDALTRYNSSDHKKMIEAADDAATAVNAAWSIPTQDQWSELWNECDFEWVQTPTAGVKVISRVTGASIFLPAVGCKYNGDYTTGKCYYWSKRLSNVSDCSSSTYFYADEEQPWSTRDGYRSAGLPIRPVRQK